MTKTMQRITAALRVTVVNSGGGGGGITEEEAEAMVNEAIGKLKLQSKTVTPTDAEQTITADEGYFGLASVIVEAAEGGGGKPISEAILTDKIENNIVVVCEVLPGGILEDTTEELGG